MRIRRWLTFATRRAERRDPHACRLALEVLENRRMLAGSLLQSPRSDGPTTLPAEQAAVGTSIDPLIFNVADSDPEGEGDHLPARQPLVLLPGILGSLPQHDFASWLALDNEAMQPGNLKIDPIKRTYDDLIASLLAVGYNDGSQPGMQTLWIAPYDWRLPVAPRDGVADGHVDTDQLDPTDTVWEFGVEYLYHWIDHARTEWEAWDLDPSLFAVDIVAHSMGGLVARSYLQSDLYRVGEIDQFLMLGTPNHGAVDAYQVREWIDVSLGLAPDMAAEKVAAGLAHIGPVGAMAGTTLVAGAQVLNSPTVEAYSPSITDLLPTFDFISKVWPHKWVRGIDDNSLLADLNSSYDYAVQGVDVAVLFATGLETDYELYHPLGVDLLNMWFYDELPAGSGDGTVLASSAQLPGVAHKTLDKVAHVEMGGADVRVQQEVFEFLGIGAPVDGYRTGDYRSLAEGIADWISQESKVIFAGSDPVAFVRKHWDEPSEGHTLVVRGDSYAAFENEVLVVEASHGVLANDSNSDGGTLGIQLVQPPLHGELVLHNDGGFTYLPERDFNREDAFRYRVSDDLGNSELATVEITVATEFPWHNGAQPQDVNADGHVSPIDALAVITTLNLQGGRVVPGEQIRPLVAPFYDVSRDGAVSPIDALIVISHLNSSGPGEAEGEGATGSLAVFEEPRIAVSVISADNTHTGRDDRSSHLQGDVQPVASLTGFPHSEPPPAARLAEEYRATRTDMDLEEILSDITAAFDGHWKGWWR